MDLEIKSKALRKALNIKKNLSELSEDELNKITILEINLTTQEQKKNRDGDPLFEQELGKVLNSLQRLKNLKIVGAYTKKDMLLNINLECGITEELESLELYGIDLSKTDLEKFFQQHTNLSKRLTLDNCNISNIKFLDFLTKGVNEIDISKNPILAEYADYILKLRQERFSKLYIYECTKILNVYKKRKHKFSSRLISSTGYRLNDADFYFAFERILDKDTKDISINDMVQLSQYIDFFSDEMAKKQRRIYIDEIDEISEEYIKNIIFFTKGENTTLVLTLEEAQILKGKVPKDIKVQLVIKNAADLSVEQLDELNETFNLNSIRVEDPNQSLDVEQETPYDIDTYRKCRSVIDELLQGIDLNTTEPNRDKKIFGKVIKRLAQKISYDYTSLKKEKIYKERMHEIIRKELESDGITDSIELDHKVKDTFSDIKKKKREKEGATEISVACRNMVGGLLNNTCVCAGYAEIVRNVFACCGIDAKYISGYSTVSGHAWNQINLDGQWYNLDLTWDRDDIVCGKPLKYTLKSDQDFDHSKYIVPYFDREKIQKCESSLNMDELQAYIYGHKKDINQNPNEIAKTQASSRTQYYSPNAENKDLPTIYEILKALERDMTKTEIEKSFEILAKTREEREKSRLTTKEMEENYDNR